jgi:Folate-sensitive fragile site protein Fra10Ac1
MERRDKNSASMASVSGSASALERHQQLMSIYSSAGQSDKAVLASNHQFVRDDTDDSKNHGKDEWGIRMARKYYAKLFKE